MTFFKNIFSDSEKTCEQNSYRCKTEQIQPVEALSREQKLKEWEEKWEKELSLHAIMQHRKFWNRTKKPI